jgi:hypothetical protein
MNAMLKAADGTVSTPIHPRCRTLLRGLETVKIKPGVNYVEHGTREQYVTIAPGYLVTRLFPARRDVKTGRKLAMRLLGIWFLGSAVTRNDAQSQEEEPNGDEK